MAGVRDIGYINARIYGLRSYLLSNYQFDELVEAKSLREIIEILRETSYREFIQKALGLTRDQLHAIDVSVNEYVSFIINKILSFTDGPINKIFNLIFQRYDVSNLKIALRGLITEVLLDKSFIPFGKLSFEDLANISASKDIKEAYSWLQTYRTPLARPIRKFLNLPVNLFNLDTAINQYYYNNAIKSLRLISGEDRINSELALRMFYEEIELTNILNILNIISQVYHNIFSPAIDLTKIMIPGRIKVSSSTIENLIRDRNLEELLNICKLSTYRSYFAGYHADSILMENISELYKKIENQFILNQIRRAFRGVNDMNLALAYFWQLTAENRNLRLIAHGVFGFLHPDDIKRNLIND